MLHTKLRAIQVHDGKLYVNGKARNEPYIYQAPAYKMQKLTVPSDNVSLYYAWALCQSVLALSVVTQIGHCVSCALVIAHKHQLIL